jgi:hypothetical protein
MRKSIADLNAMLVEIVKAPDVGAFVAEAVAMIQPDSPVFKRKPHSQLVGALQGHPDCRTLKQWSAAGRKVKTGETARYVYGPLGASGFQLTMPVFGLDQTESRDGIDPATPWTEPGEYQARLSTYLDTYPPRTRLEIMAASAAVEAYYHQYPGELPLPLGYSGEGWIDNLTMARGRKVKTGVLRPMTLRLAKEIIAHTFKAIGAAMNRPELGTDIAKDNNQPGGPDGGMVETPSGPSPCYDYVPVDYAGEF